MLSEKTQIDNNITHAENKFFRSHTSSACNNAVPTNHGISDAFSTGSQNQKPPHPNSRYDHQLPNTIPNVKKHHAINTHGFVHFAHCELNSLHHSDVIANANTTENPTYP